MKKALSILGIAAILLTFTACKTNMRRDVKRLTHKTEQCFSIVNGIDMEAETLDKFNSCYDDLEELMNEYDQKYSDDKSSKEFSKMFMEEIRKSDLNDDTKEMFEQIYSFSNL